jgi:magnesium chelatase family protein
MDRIDIRVDLPPVDLIALSSHEGAGEPSSAIAERVAVARERAAFRWSEHGWATNAEATGPEIRRQWRFGARTTSLLDRAARLGRLTGRGYDRVLRLALTSADLASRAHPSDEDVASALALRCGEAA